jgi:hypothetical protein
MKLVLRLLRGYGVSIVLIALTVGSFWTVSQLDLDLREGQSYA